MRYLRISPLVAGALLALAMMLGSHRATACTNYLITPGASADGSSMVTYAADSHYLYGELYFWPAAVYPKGALLKVYEWDSGKYMGDIPQVEKTYRVVGNMNEHQLAIAETTFGGHEQLIDKTAIIDYGSLIYITLQRAKNAREAIKVMSELVSKYGYASAGESFSIIDPKEVWILEMVGKGYKAGTSYANNPYRGAAWVAMRVPDGYVCGHANQARIQKFPKANGKTSITDKQMKKIFNPEVSTVYSADVYNVAKRFGFFKGKEADFSFSDTFNPVEFGGARGCDARVWTFFRKITDGMDRYENYVLGRDLTNRMPLWVKPNKKITLEMMMESMRDHYEGTALDMTTDPGAGPDGLPYRWRPMYWKYNGKEYCNERAVATQQSGFVFVAQSRASLPDPVGGVLWFGVDDADATVYNPIYCGITEVPEPFRVGNGSMLEYSPTSAFWLFNKVTNFCYLRYNLMHADLRKLQVKLESQYRKQVLDNDARLAELCKSNPEGATKALTTLTKSTVENTFNEWDKLFQFLLLKYMDGNVKQEREGKFVPSEHSPKIPAKVSNPDYPDWWKKQVVDATGDKLEVK